MKLVRQLAVIVTVLSLFSVSAKAQSGFGTRPTVGIFGGLTLPYGDFSDEVGVGGHVGGLVSIRAYKQLDVRLDGAWNKFAQKKIEFSDATLETYAKIIYGSLDGVVNLGADSSAYPGDRSVTPFLSLGGGVYHLDYDEDCTGNCGAQSEANTYFGTNLGVGTNATFGPLHPMAEIRWHRMWRDTDHGGNRSMFTFSVGLRFR
jgi:hypothetical protein